MLIKENFLPGSKLTIDESMIQFKDRYTSNQYLPNIIIKRVRRIGVLVDNHNYF